MSERQSRIAFDTARRMVQLDPELIARVQVFQDKLYMSHHDATLYPLPADAILGANPTLTIVDELGVVDADVFEAMRLASGKRAESTLLAIGTPPSDPPTGGSGRERRDTIAPMADDEKCDVCGLPITDDDQGMTVRRRVQGDDVVTAAEQELVERRAVLRVHPRCFNPRNYVPC